VFWRSAVIAELFFFIFTGSANSALCSTPQPFGHGRFCQKQQKITRSFLPKRAKIPAANLYTLCKVNKFVEPENPSYFCSAAGEGPNPVINIIKYTQRNCPSAGCCYFKKCLFLKRARDLFRCPFLIFKMVYNLDTFNFKCTFAG